MKRKNRAKLFKGKTPLIIDEDMRPKEFYAHAATEPQGTVYLRRKMNRARGCSPEAYLQIEVEEVIEKTQH